MWDDVSGLLCPECRRLTVTCSFCESTEYYSPSEGLYSEEPDEWCHACSNPECGYRESWPAYHGYERCGSEHVTTVPEPPPPPVRIDPAWLTWNSGCVVALAREIDRTRDPAALPVLADALEEAGCADPQVLGSCRVGTLAAAQAVLNRLLGRG